jgi:DNA-binding response OmpR family regulator
LDPRTVLIVDADPIGAALIELGLKREGYSVAVVNSADEAIVRLEEDVVDLVLCDTVLAGGDRGASDGLSLLAVVRAHPRLSVPIIMLSSSAAAPDNARALDLGAEDVLCKPFPVSDLVARVRALFARLAQRAIATAPASRVSGSTHDLSVVELIQAFEAATKSGALKLRNGSLEATLVFRSGVLVDATVGKLTGQDAACRAMLWGEASFEIVFAPPESVVPSARAIGASTAAVILEGLRRADDWGRLLKELPPLGAHLSIPEDDLLDKLADIPDEVDGIIKLIDGSRTLLNVVDDSPFDDVSTLETLVKLRASGLLVTVNEPDVQPMSLSRRVRQLDVDPSSSAIVPLPGEGASGPHDAPSASVAVGKVVLKREAPRVDERAPQMARIDPRAEPPTPTPQPVVRIDATMPSAVAPARRSGRPVWSSVPPSPEEARRWRIRGVVLAILALVAGFLLVALLRGWAQRAA